MTFNLLSQQTDRWTNKEDEDEGSPVDDIGDEIDDERDVDFDVEEGEDWTEKSAENLQHLREAVKAVKNGQTNRQAAHNYGINKSSLWRAVRNFSAGKSLVSLSEASQSRRIFSLEEEAVLVEYLLKASRVGFSLDTSTLKSLAYDLAIRNNETALSTSQKPQKVVAESRVKQVAQLVFHERGETITMLGIINATGNSLPPCLVFPRKQFKPHMIFGAPPGTHGFANPSGWMTKQLFVECFRHIHRHVRSTPENKVLVILDNQESHISIKAVGTMASSC
ncbi:tigger transposable element-derived protein 6 [Plakobranchus ocellatus]|uniref:Tigger transposable element-derived protein 6 n=1 Tax=Plakobranchus ocellatus TaxID=259542 RepID=A0AAV3YS55_9GAST|nr:tigger transposable element-derived protein 6 [Plakobranchus ocellatus]